MFSRALSQTLLAVFRVGPQTPLLQSSEIPNLGLTAQTGNFWLTPCTDMKLYNLAKLRKRKSKYAILCFQFHFKISKLTLQLE